MLGTHIRYQGAVMLPAIDLWLDPRSRQDWAFISHAHSDHLAAHTEAMLTEATYQFACQRKSPPGQASILPFGEPRRLHGVTCTLYPAGHILGSAQILVEIDGLRILYSGDFKLQHNYAAESIVVPTADLLIMETTFGHCRYAFPPAEEVVREMASWCDAGLAAGVTPVLLGYSLGKGQEMLAALADRGYRFLLHAALYDTTRLAADMGMALPPFERWTPGLGEGAVVLCPPHLRKWIVPKLPPCRTAIVSGWAADPAARYRYGADAAFCLSDHADYEDLLTYVNRVQPQGVYTVHGYATEFAAELRRRGYQASALDEPDQLNLF